MQTLYNDAIISLMSSSVIEIYQDINPDFDPFDDVADDDFDPFEDAPGTDIDGDNCDDVQYSKSDFQAAWESVSMLRDVDVRSMLSQGFTLKQIQKADRDAIKECENITKEVNRDFKEVWESQTDGYDIVDVAHAAGVELGEFDKIASRLGMGKNWSEGAERRRKYKETKIARRGKIEDYQRAVKLQNEGAPADSKSTLIVTPAIKTIITPPRLKVRKLVTLDNLAAMSAKLARVPSNRIKPGAPRMWHKAGAVRW